MRFTIVCLFIFFSWQVAFSAECNSITSTLMLYQCATKNHPDVKGAELSLTAAQAANEKITQLPNPDLSIKSITGKNAGENEGSTEIQLSLNMTELLVRRSSLNQLGRAEEKMMTVDAQEKLFNSRMKIIKSLYRYRQILNELEIVTDALETFQRIQNQLLSRRARGPEQEISLNLVELAQGDYTLKRNHLNVEKSGIEAMFKGIFGPQFELTKKYLPDLKKTWPEVTDASVSRETFEVRRLDAEKERAYAEKTVAQIDSWPQISAGPVYQRTTNGSNRFDSYGINVTVGLPILSFNSGGRALAGKNLIKSQSAYDYALQKSEMEIQVLFHKYKTAVETLRVGTSNESLKKKHLQIDGFFKQGLASGSTVIEAHRQITSFVESQHEHEIVALESLMYINLLRNAEISEVLQ